MTQMTQKNNTKSDVSGNTRKRNWAFTLNNYTELDIKYILDTFAHEKLYIFQEEIGKNNTKHLQGTVGFLNAKSFKVVRKIIPRGHWEIVRKLKNSIRYCNKKDTKNGKQWKKNVDKYLLKNEHKKQIIPTEEQLSIIKKKIHDKMMKDSKLLRSI